LSKINDGLTRSGTGCFIAGRQRVTDSTFTFTLTYSYTQRLRNRCSWTPSNSTNCRFERIFLSHITRQNVKFSALTYGQYCTNNSAGNIVSFRCTSPKLIDR